MDEKIIMTIFTDPMMGLSYESEPIVDQLQDVYRGQIEIRYVMSLLVRDVADFMTPKERAMKEEEGIRCYCRRLAMIYKSEEGIGGLPMNMDGFCLFDPQHRSSMPLNLAYKAAQLADPAKADEFLIALRHATVLECRPTTHLDEIMHVVRSVGISEESFMRYFQGESARRALEADLAFTHSLGIHSLPAYLLQFGDKMMLMQSFYYGDFEKAILQLCGPLLNKRT